MGQITRNDLFVWEEMTFEVWIHLSPPKQKILSHKHKFNFNAHTQEILILVSVINCVCDCECARVRAYVRVHARICGCVCVSPYYVSHKNASIHE